MNPFLRLEGMPDWHSRRVYGLVDSLEPDGARRDDLASIMLDCIDADWFDSELDSLVRFDRDFDRVPLSVVEIEVTPAIGNARWLDRALPWLEIEFADAPTELPPARYFRNLFGEAQSRPLKRIRAVSDELAKKLSVCWELPPELDAEPSILESLLEQIPQPDFVSVLDVGQGNWNALWRDGDGAQMYFDTGGGVLQNRGTFPSGIVACVSARPLVVLSHWDWDHWSSAQRFPQLQQLPWIAPRQYPLGGVHRTFAQSLILNGVLRVWPVSLTHLSNAILTVERCTGTTRNSNGLALTVHGPGDTSDQRQHILCPSDADYRHISSVAGTRVYTGVVVPHHGGRSRFTERPPSPITQHHRRLVYSFGAGNTYKHPNAQTVTCHQNAGWLAADTRETSNPAVPRPAHVVIHWNATPLKTGCTPCDAVQK